MDREILVENRLALDWPGLNFPGGHVKDNESIEESAIREIKEETGLDVFSLEEMGHFEWNEPKQGVRHLAMLFRSKDFKGKTVSSTEGPIFWVRAKDIGDYKQSVDFDKLVRIMTAGLEGF